MGRVTTNPQSSKERSIFAPWRHTFDPRRDISDLAGKVMLVTGGNAGLGKETVLQLAQHNPSNIFLAARSQAKSEAAIAEIRKVQPHARITFLHLDLASLKSVRAAAETVLASSDRLHVLINNAGVMALPAGLTSEGYEIQFGTNHMGHFLLTRLLLPLLKQTAATGEDVRIINVCSNAHTHLPADGLLFDSLNTTMTSHNTFSRYAQSKLANVLHARELARRNPDIKCIAAHPGGVDTGIGDAFAESHPWIATIATPLTWFTASPSQGALTQLWAATSKDAETGTFYVPTAKRTAGSANSRCEKSASRLWDWSEAQVVMHGF